MDAISGERWYRYEEQVVWSFDADGDARYSYMSLKLREFPVLRHTPKGAWLRVSGEERWVNRETRKRFACPTKSEALESLRARKRVQISVLSAKIRRAERVLEEADFLEGRAFGG